MKYCVTTKISTTDVYNNELLVESVHSDFDKALKKSTNGQSVIEINDHVKKGDSINSDGELWQSSLASDISLALRAIENQAYDNDRHRRLD